MRLRLALLLLVCVTPLAIAAEKQEIDRLQKAGGRVIIDRELTANARLRVTFATLDDKTGVLLRGATHVGSLTVEDASKLTDRTLAIIGTLTGLQELSLGRPGITNTGMANLKSLKELRKLFLFDARVFDSGVAYLKDLEHLEELDLSGSGITNAAAATFKSLDALKMLAVNKTKFNDAGAAQLKDLSSLKSLEADISVKAAMDLEAMIPGIRIRR